MIEKALFTFRAAGSTFGVFRGEFLQGAGMGFQAGALREGPTRDAYDAARAAYIAADAGNADRLAGR